MSEKEEVEKGEAKKEEAKKEESEKEEAKKEEAKKEEAKKEESKKEEAKKEEAKKEESEKEEAKKEEAKKEEAENEEAPNAETEKMKSEEKENSQAENAEELKKENNKMIKIVTPEQDKNDMVDEEIANLEMIDTDKADIEAINYLKEKELYADSISKDANDYVENIIEECLIESGETLEEKKESDDQGKDQQSKVETETKATVPLLDVNEDEENNRDSTWVNRPTECLFQEFLLLNAPSDNEKLMKKIKAYNDPILKHLTAEFQNRLGQSPLVKSLALRVRNSTEYIKVLHVFCLSFAEISRVIRAASTMNLYVRCCGNLTSFNNAIYADDYTVMIQINKLCDTDTICLEKLIKADYTHETVVKVAAGVSIKEFYNFQQKNNFNIRTDVENTKHTVVGSIVCGRHTLISYPEKNKYATLADLVKEIRIVDCNGNMNTFRDDGTPDKQNELKYAVANLGLLGIVYDVKLSITAKAMTEVNYEYATLHGLMEEPEKLIERLKNRYSLQLIYTPFNSMEFHEGSGDARVWKWIAERDQIMIRSVDIVDSKDQVDERQMIKLVSESGPHYSFLDETDLTPMATKSCFKEQFITFRDSCNQELTWAMHCFEELPNDCNDLTLSIPISKSGEEISKVFKIISQTLRQKILVTKKNFSVNVCVLVSFTGPTKLPLCPGKAEDNQIVAHFCLVGLRYSDDQMKIWSSISNEVSKQVLENFPEALPQWSTQWNNIEKIDDRLHSHYDPYFEEFRIFLDKYDRQGLFMTVRLRKLLYPKILNYREQFLTRHNKMMAELASEFYPTCISPMLGANEKY